MLARCNRQISSTRIAYPIDISQTLASALIRAATLVILGVFLLIKSGYLFGYCYVNVHLKGELINIKSVGLVKL